MTADIKLLPLPEWMSNYTIPADGFERDKNVTLVDRMHDYARANVAVALAMLQAEVEALRAEVDGTIRELIAERNTAREDAERLAFLAGEPVIEGFVGDEKDIYDYAFDAAEDSGRDEPNEADMLAGLRRMIDAAIDRARGEGGKEASND